MQPEQSLTSYAIQAIPDLVKEIPEEIGVDSRAICTWALWHHAQNEELSHCVTKVDEDYSLERGLARSIYKDWRLTGEKAEDGDYSTVQLTLCPKIGRHTQGDSHVNYVEGVTFYWLHNPKDSKALKTWIVDQLDATGLHMSIDKKTNTVEWTYPVYTMFTEAEMMGHIEEALATSEITNYKWISEEARQVHRFGS